jgi:hypothetical protein
MYVDASWMRDISWMPEDGEWKVQKGILDRRSAEALSRRIGRGIVLLFRHTKWFVHKRAPIVCPFRDQPDTLMRTPRVYKDACRKDLHRTNKQ